VKQEALDLLRVAGDNALSAAVLADLANMTAQQGVFDKARPLATEALALRREAGNAPGIAHATFALAHVEFLAGNFARAIELLEGTLEPTREAGINWAEAQSLTMMGNAYRRLADHAQARDHLQRGLELADEAGDLPNVSEAVEGAAALASLLGDFEGAARLYGAAAACREEAAVSAMHVEDRDRDLAAVRRNLGADVFERYFGEGRSLSVADAVARALAEIRAID
jgi:tetratricopeptide (TPR) repeat protein